MLSDKGAYGFVYRCVYATGALQDAVFRLGWWYRGWH
jgi:hypothetical protein